MIQQNPQPAPLMAYDWVRAYITSLAPSEEAFLSEATIASEAGVSRTPVREAIMRLEAEGFLKRIPNKGAYVPPITDPDVRVLLEARGVVERWVVEHSLEALKGAAGELQLIIDQQREAAHDVNKFIELDIDFHSRMVRLGNNSVITDFYSSLRQRQLRVGVKAVVSGADRDHEVLVEHQRILDAIVSGDPEEVNRSIDDHLHSTLLAVTRP